MTPLSLTLKNFIGIQSGLKRDSFTIDLRSLDGQVIALRGDNGAGKSTILDNLHPYRIMPSRAKNYSPKAFSYYSQVYGNEASKELEWSFNGVVYKSILQFKLGKTNSTTAFLQVFNDSSWEPYENGSLSSDGKTITYDQCVVDVLGSPDLFFTAAFSAQNRTSLSEYDQSTVKSLMAELLDMTEIETLHEKCSVVIRELKRTIAGCNADEIALKNEIDGYRGVCESLKSHEESLTLIADQVAKQEIMYSDAVLQLSEANELNLRNKLDLERITELENKSSDLFSNQESYENRKNGELSALGDKLQQNSIEIKKLKVKSEHSIANLERKIKATETTFPDSTLEDCLAKLDKINESLPDTKSIDALNKKLSSLEVHGDNTNKIIAELRQALSDADSKIVTLKDKISEYQKTANLIDEVPCCDTPLPDTCKLLHKAKYALNQIPAMEHEVSVINDEIIQATSTLHAAESDRTTCREEYVKIRSIIDSLHARQELLILIEKHKLSDIHREHIAEYRENINQVNVETRKKLEVLNNEKSILNGQIDNIKSELEIKKDSYSTKIAETQKNIFDIRSKMKFPKIPEIEAAIKSHERSLEKLKSEEIVAREKITKTSIQAENLTNLEEKFNDLTAFSEKIGRELSCWLTLSIALSRNGIIALSIDDAGPSISAIANQILTECYGHRFTVSIETQGKTAKGDVKEIFDIIVFDSEHDVKKSVREMSGGERIWINESIARAIALYQAEQSSIHYETLFADESDGALDHEHKNMFMGMKRKVIELGGYSKEYFISHTADLWGKADSIINLNEYKAE